MYHSTRGFIRYRSIKCIVCTANSLKMSEFGVLDCIIRDSGGMSNSLNDRNDFEDDATSNWQDGGFDVLSASMHDSGLLGSNGLEENNEVSFDILTRSKNWRYKYFMNLHKIESPNTTF